MSKIPYLPGGVLLGQTLDVWATGKGCSRLWPFPSVNGEQTPESKALQALPPEPKQSLYNQVMSDPDTLEALL